MKYNYHSTNYNLMFRHYFFLSYIGNNYYLCISKISKSMTKKIPYKHCLKNYITIGTFVATVIFILSYILIIAFKNPLANAITNDIISTEFILYFLIMIGYWIYCTVKLLLSKTETIKNIGRSFLFGMFLFFACPIFLQQGLLTTPGTCLIIGNIIAWSVYYIIKKDQNFLLLICGFLVILLTVPYCSILWD